MLDADIADERIWLTVAADVAVQLMFAADGWVFQ
jgi:hypothetical protein